MGYLRSITEFEEEGYILEKYYNLVKQIGHESYMMSASNIRSQLLEYLVPMYKYDVEKKYSKPMVYIGFYIVFASLCCIIAMVADLVHGLRSRKLWIPCKYVRINAASLAVIAVALKLPVDLSGSMPGVLDQVAKIGSMAFMCTMMANLLPCLATMDSTALLANITAFGVLVITLVVNVGIQIQTGVVKSYNEEIYVQFIQNITDGFEFPEDLLVLYKVTCSTIAKIYVTMLVVLLIIHVCSSLAILKSKQIIESKYQQQHNVALTDVQQLPENFSTFEKLEQHVKKYWIMAGSGSPQFILAFSATTTASGVICALTAILHTLTMGWTISYIKKRDYDSDYDWSMPLIVIVQFIGVILGTIAPLSRCFASLSFKVSMDSILKHIMVFKVESYWTQKLSDWKHDSIRFPLHCHKRNVVLKNMKSLILEFSIQLQGVVVVLCKIIALIFYFFMVCVVYCFKWLLQVVICSPGKSTENLQHHDYVLRLDNEMELTERILKGLAKSLNKLIQKGKNKQPNNLINLLKEKSTIDFQGAIRFDNNDHPYCWSLAVVTLTTIAVTLRKIKKVEVDSLLKSVREGLEYVTLVEKTLNATDDNVNIRKAAEKLWEDVDMCHKWLGIKLNTMKVKAADGDENSTMHVVKVFQELAEGMGSTDGLGPNGDSKFMSICKKSMSHITTAIIEDHKESHKKSFDEVISSRIADIIAECLTNLPKVIEMKCHTSVIEKREASVQAAAQLLGETEEIIKFLEDPSRHVPSTNP